MNCPRDASPLQSEHIQNADVLRCPVCGGMFLEHGDLNRVAASTSGDLEFSTLDQDTFQHDDGAGLTECPRDRDVMMKKVEFNIGTNIILDWCETCRGFWLDANELVRINEEVRDLNEAERELSDPPLVRLAQFFWGLPFPR